MWVNANVCPITNQVGPKPTLLSLVEFFSTNGQIGTWVLPQRIFSKPAGDKQKESWHLGVLQEDGQARNHSDRQTPQAQCVSTLTDSKDKFVVVKNKRERKIKFNPQTRSLVDFSPVMCSPDLQAISTSFSKSVWKTEKTEGGACSVGVEGQAWGDEGQGVSNPTLSKLCKADDRLASSNKPTLT